MNDKWIPEICYEESGEGLTGGFPFIKVPEDKVMPSALFISEARDIKEEDVEQETEVIMHMFVNMTTLKQNLDVRTLNRVRKCLGLEPLGTAKRKGERINKKVLKNIS